MQSERRGFAFSCMMTEEEKRTCCRRKCRDVGWRSREIKEEEGKQSEGEGQKERMMEGGEKDVLVT